jgi:DNA polymerase-1
MLPQSLRTGSRLQVLIADYNQIELRYIAHLAEDPGLISAFKSGQDIHNATGLRRRADCSLEQRSSEDGVVRARVRMKPTPGQQLNIPTDRLVILGAYFEAFPT